MKPCVCVLLTSLLVVACGDKKTLNLDVSGSSLTLSSSTSPADATTPVVITVVARQANGTPVSGVDVTLSIADSTIVNPTTTGADGSAQGQIISSVAGTRTVHAQMSLKGVNYGAPLSARVTFSSPQSLRITFAETQLQAGATLHASVRAVDAAGNPFLNYFALLTTHSTDAQAVLDANVTLPPATGGTALFSVVFVDAGSQTLTVTDAVTGLTGASTFTVDPGATQTLVVSKLGALPTPPAQAATGAWVQVVIVAQDPYNNVTPAYRGTTTFSSPGSATLPANQTFSASDAGRHTMALFVPFTQNGNFTLMAADVDNHAVSGGNDVGVGSGPISQLAVILCGTCQVGTAMNFNVFPQDAFGNYHPEYSGVVTFTSSDSSALLPGNVTFTPPTYPSPFHYLTLAMYKSGAQSLTVTDVAQPSLSTTTLATLTPGDANHLHIAMRQDPVACLATPLQVTAYDVYENIATGYTGTVSFTSSDGQATLPGNVSFSSQQAGVYTAAAGAQFNTLGAQTLQVADTTTSSLLTTSNLTVLPAQIASFALTGIPATLPAGTSQAFSATAYDTCGIQAAGYTGTAVFSSTDAGAYVPLPYAFLPSDAGAHTFTPGINLATAGSQTFVMADSVDPNAAGRVSTTVSGDAVAILSLGAGSDAPCVVLGDANVKCWGWDANGNLGYGDTANRGSAANQMGSDLPNVDLGGHTARRVSTFGGNGNELAVYGDGTCAQQNDGSIACWGNNSLGQLGLGDTTARSTAAAVSLPAGRTAVAVSGSGYDTCALLDTGSVTCWGANVRGELGVGDTAPRYTAATAPAAVHLPTGRTAVAISTGYAFACALLDSAQVSCWGFNGQGQLGLGDTTDRTDPQALPPVALGTGRTALQVQAGMLSACALLDTHDVKCWGLNSDGQLGLGDLVMRTDAASPPINFGTGRTATSLAVGYNSACAILDTQDTVCWGNNSTGQVGVGDTQGRRDPSVLAPLNVGTGRTALSLAVGRASSCALLDNRTVTCWGSNTTGTLGLGDTVDRLTPTGSAIALW